MRRAAPKPGLLGRVVGFTRKVGLRGRFVAIMILGSVVFGTTVLFFLDVMVHDALVRRTSEGYQQLLDVLAPSVRDQVLTGQTFSLQMSLADIEGRHAELEFLAVTDREGRLIATSRGDRFPERLAAFLESEAARHDDERLVFLRQGDQVLLHRRVPLASFPLGDLHAGIDMAPMEALAGRITRRLGVLFAVLTFVGVAVAFMMGGVLTEPLRRMTALARRIGGGDLSGRLPVDSASEVGDLAIAFNDMVRQLAQSRTALLRTEKLAALGRLAAGLAHEINNPLASLRALLWVLRKPDLKPEKRAEHVAALDHGLQRIAATIERLLDFARPKPVRKTPTQLAVVVESAVALVSPAVEDKGRVKLEVDASGDVRPIEVDPSQIEQVIVNLLLNAIHAMEGSDERGGTIRIRLRADDGVQKIEIEDEGPGIPPEDLDKVFEPFFSTRPEGKGTGLGLAVSQSIVEAHGGTLDLQPGPGGVGLLATLTLPEH